MSPASLTEIESRVASLEDKAVSMENKYVAFSTAFELVKDDVKRTSFWVISIVSLMISTISALLISVISFMASTYKG